MKRGDAGHWALPSLGYSYGHDIFQHQVTALNVLIGGGGDAPSDLLDL